MVFTELKLWVIYLLQQKKINKFHSFYCRNTIKVEVIIADTNNKMIETFDSEHDIKIINFRNKIRNALNESENKVANA